MFQHKALGNHMSAAARGYVVEVRPPDDSYCRICGGHRSSRLHRAQKGKCSQEMQKKYAE